MIAPSALRSSAFGVDGEEENGGVAAAASTSTSLTFSFSVSMRRVHNVVAELIDAVSVLGVSVTGAGCPILFGGGVGVVFE